MGSVPDHLNKVNIAIKPVTQISRFPSACKSYVNTVLKSTKRAIALCLKKQCIYLNLKNTLLLKKKAHHHMSLQRGIIFLLVEGRASMSMAPD